MGGGMSLDRFNVYHPSPYTVDLQPYKALTHNTLSMNPLPGPLGYTVDGVMWKLKTNDATSHTAGLWVGIDSSQMIQDN
ncbi:hypothetical protein TNCV_651741 [Trichonephila clavipes]|nr:hypothetical protein TNCV_651741 [Trichonephila clavipes]